VQERREHTYQCRRSEDIMAKNAAAEGATTVGKKKRRETMGGSKYTER